MGERVWIEVAVGDDWGRFGLPEVRLRVRGELHRKMLFRGMEDVVRLWNLVFNTTLAWQRRGRVGLRLALFSEDDGLQLLVEAVTRIVAEELDVCIDDGRVDALSEQLVLF